MKALLLTFLLLLLFSFFLSADGLVNTGDGLSVYSDNGPITLAHIFLYIFIMFCVSFLIYLILRISAVRRAVGMTEVVEHRVSRNIIIITIFTAVFSWLIQSAIDLLVLKQGITYLESLFPADNSYLVIHRIFLMAVVLLSGLITSRVFARLARQHDITKTQEERLNLALQAANDGIWDWRPGENTIYFDDRYYTIAGYTPGDFPMRHEEWIKRVHPDYRDLIIQASRDYSSGKTDVYDVEFKFRKKDGDYIWLRARGKIVSRDDEGNITRFIGTHTDISERKKVEEALIKSEQLFREAELEVRNNYMRLKAIYESLPVTIWAVDKNGIFTLSEGKALEILGFKSGEVVGNSVFEIFKDNKDVVENIKNALDTGESVEYEVRINNNYYHSIIFPSLEQDNGISGAYGLALDITEKKEAEEELRRLRNYLSNIINSMPSVLVGVDGEGFVTQWNRTAEIITNIDYKDALGRFLPDLMPRMASEMGEITESIKTKQVVIKTKRPRYEKEGPVYEDFVIYPLITNDVQGAVIRIDDVTEMVRMEEMLIQSEKMLSIGGLAAGMAHEINNPLAGMMQTLDVMAGRLESGAAIAANGITARELGVSMDVITSFMEKRGILKMITAVKEAGVRVAKIVDNMLSFSRKTESRFENNNIIELIDRTLELASTDYDLKKFYDFKLIKITREYEKIPEVYCEATKLQQVILNLLRNAAQAMQEAGTVKPKIILRVLNDKLNSMVRIEVEDNGPGIDPETKKRVFEPFYTTKPVGIGTGLGLSVSYFIIVENHKGRMAVESVPGEGTKFSIWLHVEPFK